VFQGRSHHRSSCLSGITNLGKASLVSGASSALRSLRVCQCLQFLFQIELACCAHCEPTVPLPKPETENLRLHPRAVICSGLQSPPPDRGQQYGGSKKMIRRAIAASVFIACFWLVPGPHQLRHKTWGNSYLMAPFLVTRIPAATPGLASV
jgi:hypothetical protein